MGTPAPKRRTKTARSELHGGMLGSIFSQLALWTAANLAGMATALMISRRPAFAKASAEMGGSKRKARKPSPEQALPMLAEAVLGSSKSNIAEVFGAPRSSATESEIFAGSDAAFLATDTWYYPLPRQGPLAMAIRFNEGYADRVEFFGAPMKRLKLGM